MNIIDRHIEISQFLCGIGDAISYSRVIEEYKKEDIHRRIRFNTYFPELFEHDPHIDELSKIKWCGNYPSEGDLVNPFMIGEWKGKNLTSLLCKAAGFANTPDNLRPKYYMTTAERKFAKELLRKNKCRIVCHARGENTNSDLAHSGEIKNWPDKKWAKLIKKIPEQVITVGTKDDIFIPGSIDLRNKLNLKQVIAIVANAYLFITCDSGFYHVAASFPNKKVLILGRRHDPMSFGYHRDIIITGARICDHDYCDEYFICKETGAYSVAPCISQISENNVLSAIRPILNSNSNCEAIYVI